jgi:hypothetical protein
MTSSRDPDRLIREFLDDGLTELPDRSYEAVRSHIDNTRQRVVIGPWRKEQMQRYAMFAIAAAAIVLVAVIGIQFLPGNGGVGGPPNPTASPSPSPSPTPTPTPAALTTTGGTALAAGTYYIDNSYPEIRGETGLTRLTFTLPAGWVKPNADFLVGKDEGTPTEVMVGPWVVSHIFSDACHWDEASIVDVGTTADQAMTALASQGSRTASAVTDATFGGYPAKRIELTVSPTLYTTTCTNGILRYWPSPGRPVPDFSGGMCCNTTGNIDAIYAVDVAGQSMVVVARHYPGATAQNLAELQGVIDSFQIEP